MPHAPMNAVGEAVGNIKLGGEWVCGWRYAGGLPAAGACPAVRRGTQGATRRRPSPGPCCRGKAAVGKNHWVSRREGEMARKGEVSPAGAAGVSRERCIQVWDLLGKEVWKPESVQSQQRVMQQTRPAARGSARRTPHPAGCPPEDAQAPAAGREGGAESSSGKQRLDSFRPKYSPGMWGNEPPEEPPGEGLMPRDARVRVFPGDV